MPNLKKLQTLDGLLLNTLMAFYDVEVQISKVVPAMVKKTTDDELRQAFQGYLAETIEHVQRLEQCFTLLKIKSKKLKVEAIRGLAKDAAWVMKHIQKGPALDANLIAAAQYVAHYEIAGYGTAREWARLMGYADVADLFDQTLSEEVRFDEKLSDLAEAKINTAVEIA